MKNKFNLKHDFLMMVIGGILFSTISVIAISSIQSLNVTYESPTSNASNVQEALDELYMLANSDTFVNFSYKDVIKVNYNELLNSNHRVFIKNRISKVNSDIVDQELCIMDDTLKCFKDIETMKKIFGEKCVSAEENTICTIDENNKCTSIGDNITCSSLNESCNVTNNAINCN